MRATVASLALLFSVALGVDHAKFRTCTQTGFCRRSRNRASHNYVVAPGSLTLDASGALSGKLHGGPYGVSLSLSVVAYASGVARLRIVETNPLHGPRWEPTDILEAGITPAALKPVVVSELAAEHPLHSGVGAGEVAAYAFGSGATPTYLAVHLHPFRAHLYLGSEVVLSLNPGGKFYFEHHRKRDDATREIADVTADVHGGKTVVDYGEDGLAVYSDGTKQSRTPARARGTRSWAESCCHCCRRRRRDCRCCRRRVAATKCD